MYNMKHRIIFPRDMRTLRHRKEKLFDKDYALLSNIYGVININVYRLGTCFIYIL